MTRLHPFFVVLLAAVTLVASGCGGDDDEGGDETATPTTQAQGAAEAPTVGMKDIQFNPQTVTVKPGTKITWNNDDTVAHTVTKDEEFKGKGPQSDTLEPGDTYTFTPTTAGTIPYFCEIHPNQTGTIVVS